MKYDFTSISDNELRYVARVFVDMSKSATVGGINEEKIKEDALNTEKEHTKQINKQIASYKKARDAAQELIDALGYVNKDSIQGRREVQLKTAKILKSWGHNLDQHTIFLGRNFKRTVESVASGAKDFDDLTKSIDALNRKIEELEKSSDSLATWAKDKGKKQLSSMFGWAKGWGRTFLGTASIIRFFGKTMDDVNTAMRVGSTTLSSIFDTTGQALKLGIDPKVLMELQAQNREAMLAQVGGVKQFNKNISSVQWEWRKVTGSNAEALQTTTTLMTAMGKAGIQPNIKLLQPGGPFYNNFVRLQKLTGLVGTDFADYVKSLTADEDIRERMLATRKSERMNLLQSVIARRAELKSIFGSAEAADKAAKAMDTLAGKGAKERMAGAAKLMPILGALGLGGKAGQVYQTYIKGLRASPKERKDMLATLAEASQRYAAAKKQKGVGYELTMEQLAGGDIESLLKSVSPLDSSLKTQLDVSKDMDSKLDTGLKRTAAGWEYLQSAFGDNPIGLLTSAILASASPLTAAIAAVGLGGYALYKTAGTTIDERLKKQHGVRTPEEQKAYEDKVLQNLQDINEHSKGTKKTNEQLVEEAHKKAMVDQESRMLFQKNPAKWYKENTIAGTGATSTEELEI